MIDNINAKAREIDPEDLEHHIDEMISLTGTAESVSSVTPRIIQAAYRCPMCDKLITIPQDGGVLVRPQSCPDPFCGFTGNGERFRLDERRSLYEDIQKIHLLADTQGGAPIPVSAIAKDRLAGMIYPGSKVLIIGTPVRSGNRILLDIRTMERLPCGFGSIKLNGRDIGIIEEVSHEPLFFERFVDSVLPPSYGPLRMRQAVTLMLFSGSDSDYRSDMPYDSLCVNIVLTGSTKERRRRILKRIASLTPGSRYVPEDDPVPGGLFSTAVGKGSDMVHRAGLIPLACGSVACMEGLDRKEAVFPWAYDPSVRTEPIWSGGVYGFSLPHTCSFLAEGEYDEPVSQRLMDYFDAEFRLPDGEEECNKQGMKPFDDGFIRRYIAHSKSVDPVTDMGMEDYIWDMDSEDYPAYPTENTFWSVKRLADAYTRMHLRQYVWKESVKVARQILSESEYVKNHRDPPEPDTGKDCKKGE